MNIEDILFAKALAARGGGGGNNNKWIGLTGKLSELFLGETIDGEAPYLFTQGLNAFQQRYSGYIYCDARSVGFYTILAPIFTANNSSISISAGAPSSGECFDAEWSLINIDGEAQIAKFDCWAYLNGQSVDVTQMLKDLPATAIIMRHEINEVPPFMPN